MAATRLRHVNPAAAAVTPISASIAAAVDAARVSSSATAMLPRHAVAALSLLPSPVDCSICLPRGPPSSPCRFHFNMPPHASAFTTYAALNIFASPRSATTFQRRPPHAVYALPAKAAADVMLPRQAADTLPAKACQRRLIHSRNMQPRHAAETAVLTLAVHSHDASAASRR